MTTRHSKSRQIRRSRPRQCPAGRAARRARPRRRAERRRRARRATTTTTAACLPRGPASCCGRPTRRAWRRRCAFVASTGRPVVPQGGLTGLCGGARAIDGAVALSLERLTGIDEIDPSSSTITVRAGTPLQVVQQAVDAAGLLLPAGSRRARVLRDRRQPVDQRRRQSRHPLRHGARIGARRGSRAARRHRRRLHEQDAEEQRGLRPEAPVHRQRRHARHHHHRRCCGCFPSPRARWRRCAR